MSETRLDLLVIGVGMAGLTAAQKCARDGWSVGVVDSRPYGGTCALRGCDPKKILRRGAEVMDAATNLTRKGIDAAGAHIDWPDLMAHKRAFTDAMPGKIEAGLTRAGIMQLHGDACFHGPDIVRVGSRNLRPDHVVVATGARPRPLDFPGAEHLTGSTAFMELDALPPRVVFLGGGYVSMEFAHMAARAGARVTVVEHGRRILKAFDPDLTERLTERSRQSGIEIRLGTAVEEIQRHRDGFRVVSDSGMIDCDLVVHGAGRIADLEGLGLERAAVEATSRGLQVNEFLQSHSNPAVYAAGDAADTEGLPLTPVAVDEGSVVASNLLKGNHRTPDYTGTPSVAFTIPEIARVGLSETDARNRYRHLRVAFNDSANWYSQRRVGETHSATKILIDEDTDRILGAHLLGHGYAEAANLFALAMQNGLAATHLKRFRSAYPSVGSDLASML